MKDKSLHKVAEHLYVQDFLNLEETAKRVGVNERTIRRWQGKNNWLEKRRQFIEQHSHIHEDLYKLARSTYEIIKEDMKNGDYINPGRLNQLLNLLEAMFKTQKQNRYWICIKISNQASQILKLILMKLLLRNF